MPGTCHLISPGRALLILLGLIFLHASSGFAANNQAAWVGESLEGRQCSGGNAGGFGPYDYRFHKDKLPIVERHHFNSNVEQLIKGQTQSDPLGDIAYTLLRFPNHARALSAMVRYALREGRSAQSVRLHPPECFLGRAIGFAPDDFTPHHLLGLYLHKLGRLDAALQSYRNAEDLSPGDSQLTYNMGLLFFDMKNYGTSFEYAIRAYSGGIPYPGLRRKLQEAGHWKE